MRVSLLNLISTPVAVLNSLGLDLRVGLSSEDPTTLNRPSEHYRAFLTTYSPEGVFLDRTDLGEIPPNRRRYFDVTNITRQFVPNSDHLAVVHRVPSSLLSQVSRVEDEIELAEEPTYTLFRSLVEYSYPHGGNGALVYETPHGLNSGARGGRPPSTLTFTCQAVLSDVVNTYAILIHYSVDPAYSSVVSYNFALYSMSGEQVASDSIALGPFSINLLDMARIIPQKLVDQERDSRDGLSTFTFVGYCESAVLPTIFVNAAPSLGAVAVEHTHPPQGYLYPHDPGQRNKIKSAAQAAWKSLISAATNR